MWGGNGNIILCSPFQEHVQRFVDTAARWCAIGQHCEWWKHEWRCPHWYPNVPHPLCIAHEHLLMLVLDSLPVTRMIDFHSQELTAATQQTQACREPPNILARTCSRTHSKKVTREKNWQNLITWLTILKHPESDLAYDPQAATESDIAFKFPQVTWESDSLSNLAYKFPQATWESDWAFKFPQATWESDLAYKFPQATSESDWGYKFP